MSDIQYDALDRGSAHIKACNYRTARRDADTHPNSRTVQNSMQNECISTGDCIHIVCSGDCPSAYTVRLWQVLCLVQCPSEQGSGQRRADNVSPLGPMIYDLPTRSSFKKLAFKIKSIPVKGCTHVSLVWYFPQTNAQKCFLSAACCNSSRPLYFGPNVLHRFEFRQQSALIHFLSNIIRTMKTFPVSIATP
jgi:hypothetical protein